MRLFLIVTSEFKSLRTICAKFGSQLACWVICKISMKTSGKFGFLCCKYPTQSRSVLEERPNVLVLLNFLKRELSPYKSVQA